VANRAQAERPSNEVSAAYIRVVSKLGHAVKKDAGAAYGNYATLGAVLRKISPALHEEGLAITQYIESAGANCPACSEDNHTLMLITEIVGENGTRQRIAVCPLWTAKRDMQALGSAITYARRYSLMVAFGLAGEDDEGQATVAVQAAAPDYASGAVAVAAVAAEEWQDYTFICAKCGVERTQKCKKKPWPGFSCKECWKAGR
jgi:hypothetical protein